MNKNWKLRSCVGPAVLIITLLFVGVVSRQAKAVRIIIETELP